MMKSRKRGTVIVLTAVLIPFLLIVTMFAISLGFQGIAQSQVDAAADAASHAGAAGGAYAYERLEHGHWVKHAVVLKDPDSGLHVPGALNKAESVWNANRGTFMAGVSNSSASFNPGGMEPGKSSNDQYYEGHFWVTDRATYSNIYLPNKFFSTPPVPLNAVSETIAQPKK